MIYTDLSLSDALNRVSKAFRLNCDDMARYAGDDNIGGRDLPWNGKLWGTASIFSNEAKILYSLVRAMRPINVLEIGTHKACGTAHIAAALVANGIGELVTVDIDPVYSKDVLALPVEYRDVTTFIAGDALTIPLPQSDFVFDDGAHNYLFSKAIAKRIKAIGPKVVVSHDALCPEWGGPMVRAWNEEFGSDWLGIEVHGCRAGLAIWMEGGIERDMPVELESISVPQDPLLIPGSRKWRRDGSRIQPL